MACAVNEWRTFGASIIGPGHVLESKPNQDAWTSFRFGPSVGVAVSDGLGSKKLSNFGSKAACRAVRRAVRKMALTRNAVRDELIISDVYQSWLDALGSIDPADAAATCLFAYTTDQDSVVVGALGDGCIAVVGVDSSVRIVSSDKSSGFLNSTQALCQVTERKHWKTAEFSQRQVQAVVLCSDGVADDLDDVPGFALEISNQSSALPDLVASRLVRKMLNSWPVPKHTDDKSLACLTRRRHFDG